MSEAVARRYATALAEVAAESGDLDTVGRELDAFAALMSSGGGSLGDTLASPVFTTEERRAVLDQLLPRLGCGKVTSNLLYVVNDKKRFPLLPAIASAYRDLADARANRARIVVQSASPLSPELENEVREALERATRKQVVLTTEVVPELIGGLVAKVGDTVYDSSVRTRLEQLRRSLLQGPIAQA